MFTAAFSLSLVSILCLYAQSQKVELAATGALLFLKTKRTLARALAGSAFLLATLLFIWKMGFAVGIFTSLSSWMLIACLVILFAPFGKDRWPQLALVLAAIGGIELSVHFL